MAPRDRSALSDAGAVNVRFLLISATVFVLVALAILGLYIGQRAFSPRVYLEDMQRAIAEHDLERAIVLFEKALQKGHRPNAKSEKQTLARIYMSVSPPRVDKAIALFESAAEQDPQDVELQVILARLHLEVGNAAAARTYGRAAVENATPSTWQDHLQLVDACWILSGLAEDEAGRIEELRNAEVHLRKALELGEAELDPYRMALGSWRLHGSMIGGPNLREFLRRRVTRLNEGDRRKLETASDEWFARAQHDCGNLMIYADLCALLDRWPTASQGIRDFLGATTEADGGCIAALSFIAAESGDLDLAIELRETAVGLDPDRSLPTALVLARALQRRGEADRAAAFLDEFSSPAEDDPAVLGDIALLNTELGRLDEAAATLARLEEGGAADAATLAGLKAYLALRQGSPREALKLLGDAPAAAGGSKPPWYDFVRGEALARIGDLTGAKEALLRAWESGSDVGGLKLALAEILVRAREFREAERWIAEHEIEAEPGSSRATLLRARIALAQGQFTQAERHLREILASSADDPEALFLLATVLRDTGRADEARRFFERAARGTGSEFAAAALIESARLARQAGELQAARDLAEEALRGNPESAEALQVLDELARAQSEPSIVASRLAEDADDSTALEAAARSALADRDATAAEDALRRCLATEPAGTERWKRLWWSWISVLVSEERIDEAEQALAQARPLVGRDPVLEYAEALLAVARGEHEASLPSWELYLKSQPGDVNARTLFASSLLRVGRASEAAQQARAAVDGGGQTDRPWVLLADALYRSGDLDGAIRVAQEALERFPGSVDLLSTGADLYQLAGQMDRAIQLRQQLTQAAPGRQENYLGLAELALLSGDPSAATRWVREVAREEQTPRAVFLEAVAQFRMGNRAEADALVQDYARQNPDDADGVWRTARYFMETARPEDAVSWFDRALSGRPDDTALEVERANAIAQCGRSDEALEVLAKLDERDPGNVQVQLGRITVLLSDDRFEGALDEAHKLLAAHADVKEAYRLESQILAAMGRLDEAEDSLAKGRTLPGDTAADDYIEASILLRKLGRLPTGEVQNVLSSARESLRRVARRRPDLGELWMMLARISLELRDPKDAVASIERIERLAAVGDETCLLAVRAFGMMGDRKGELTWRERLAAIDPDNAANWIDIALRRIEAGDREGSLQAAQAAARAASSADPARVQRLVALFLALDRDQDAEEFLRSYAETEGPAAAEALRARALLDVGRLEEAEKLTAEVLESRADDPQILLTRATVLESLGRSDEALAAYERAASLDPSSEERACDYASALARTGASAKAMDVVRKVLADHPDSLRGRIVLGELLAAEGRWAEALSTAREVQERRPDLPEAVLWQARILARAADRPDSGVAWDQVIEVLDSVPRDTAYYDDALLLRAQIEAERGLLLEASERCRSVLRRRPDSLAALRLGVGLLLRRQSFREAQELIDDSARRSVPAPAHAELTGRVALAASREAVARGAGGEAADWLKRGEAAYRYLADARPDAPDAWLGLAEILAAQGRWEDAEAAAAGWVDGEQAPASVLQWSRVLRRGGRGEQADALLDRWIESHPAPFTPVHRERVDALLSQGRNEDALRLASRFADTDSRNPDALIILGQALMVTGDRERALETSRRAASIDADPPADVLERHAAVLFEMGLNEEAVETLNRILSEDPGRPMAMNNLAWILAVSDPPDLERALDLVRRARSMVPDDPSILDTEGLIQWKLGDPYFAAELFRRSLGRRPAPAVRLRLAETLAAVGKSEEAAREARTVLESGAPPDVVGDAQALLDRIGAGS